jgi:signal transduction histidine kinase
VAHVLAQALPERDTRGRISGFVGAVTDLSRHLEVQKELRANRERVELALMANTEGCWDWDIATGGVHLSQRGIPVPGCPPGELEFPARALTQRIHPEDRARAVRELCRNVVRHARAPRAAVRIHTEEGRIRIVVADDGEGFDASAHARRFEIESAPGKGARAVLSVPLG